jgi:endoglucanase
MRRNTYALLAAVAVPLALGAVTTPVTAASAAAPAARTATAAAVPNPALAENPTNPLANRKWGVYKGKADQAWQPYVDATGTDKTLLGKIALRPRATWFGAWTADSDIAAKVNKYVDNMSGGDPNVLVQMSVFRMKPWEHNACTRLPTAAEQSSYKTWINRFAGAVGAQHTAIILQPDGPFALCAPGGSKLPSQLIGYAARAFAALPNTAVYIDAGASDWPSKNPKQAADILMPASIQHVRGFALDATHYTSTGENIAFGTQVVDELASRGVPDKHFIINTAQNGKAFTWSQKRTSNFDNSPVCRSKADTRCVTLGVPPTMNVTNPAWHINQSYMARAAAHCDGYVWFGRPWLNMQSDPFVKSRALQLVRTTRY